MTIEEKGENLASVNRIEGTKRGHGKRNQSRGGRNEEKIEVTVGGCKLNMIIDSGASTDIIDKETWEWLKKNKVKCESARSRSNSPSAKFCVINGEGDPLLGKDTTTGLGVLKIGIGIAAVSADPKTIGGILQQKYPNVFSGVGKLKDRAVQLHIDPNVTPVAQPMRRTPFSMRSKLLRLLPTAVCSDTRDYCLVLTLLPNSTSTTSRQHLRV
ncbi:unnamed protein product [Porites lobata]|uniref:Peptidase A2 domain-containing protein n=1 Tax=Porites lobata TaxID=104759 RepID=A0ABN8Q2K5_9CNID|nr:unnamed protein product [Porites lobata]